MKRTVIRIGDIASIGRGSSPRPITDKKYFEDGKIPWIKIADATASGKYIYETKEYVNELGASYSRRMKPGTLILSASGVSLGIPHFLGVEGCIHDGWIYMDNIHDIDQQYLYYLLLTMRTYFDNLSYGAAIQNINTPILSRTKIEIPLVECQIKISTILSMLDDLIECNVKRIKVLEEMAENLYKEWFVRFRFPGYEDVEFEGGIPKIWSVKKLNEILSLLDSRRKPMSSMERDGMDQNYPYYGAAGQLGYVEDYIFDGTYLLLGEDGSVITEEGYPYLQYVWGKIWVNNHAHIIEKNGKYSVEFLYCMFKKMNIQAIVTGVAQPKISKGRLMSRKTIIPDDDTLVKFDKLIQPIFAQIKKLTDSNTNLIKQRDLLLPRLMSGKLEVK